MRERRIGHIGIGAFFYKTGLKFSKPVCLRPSLFAQLLLLSYFCGAQTAESAPTGPQIVVLGIAQDAGYPQAGCGKDCCAAAWVDSSKRRMVSCLALVDPVSGQRWIFDATPDFPKQLRLLDEIFPPEIYPGIDGILLTHAHIGHYTGLMHVGREVMGAEDIPVYAMPRMRIFLRDNGPWSQLVALKNIDLRSMAADSTIRLSERMAITPLQVPHRDEFSETVGFVVQGPSKKVLFIPDIDKWERWDRSIEKLIAQVDIAYLDATFYANGEIPGRDMATIPHPFIAESMQRFSALPAAERAKIRFIHLNHTNPALQADSEAARAIVAAGYAVAVQGEQYGL